MTGTKNTAKQDTKKRTSVGLGRIRIDDDSLDRTGHHKGDVLLIKLHAKPKNGDLCAAFTAYGKLVIRYFHREENGDIRLTRSPDFEIIEVFAPRAVIIFGPVVGVEKGGAG